jgi:hypothetical protein
VLAVALIVTESSSGKTSIITDLKASAKSKTIKKGD